METAKSDNKNTRAAQIVYADLMPWERQPDEGPEAYRLFVIYRDCDPSDRGYKYVCEASGQGRTSITAHSSHHRWVERAAAWDFHLERARLQRTEQYQAEMAARHADIAKSMLDKLKERLINVKLSTLGPKEIAQWLDVGVKVERLSRGLQDEKTIQNNYNAANMQINHMSDAEIESEIAREGNQRGASRKANRAALMAEVLDGQS